MSTTPPSESQPPSGISAAEARQRDARGAAILGWFHLALGATVLTGTMYATLPIDRVLNVAAAVVLAIVGAGLLWGSRRLSRSAARDSSER
jgi:hypothetical protein